MFDFPLNFLMYEAVFMSYEIGDDCIGCGICAGVCPADAVSGEHRKRFVIDFLSCESCGACFETCPKGAVLDPEGNRRPNNRKRKKGQRARIDRDLCARCRTCELSCPREAITFIKGGFLGGGGYCEVEEELCSGCGKCAKLCITGASELE